MNNATDMNLTLVLMPGLDGTGTLFTDFVSELPPKLTVRIARYPTETFLSYADLLPYVKEAVPAAGCFILVAESFSTPLAAMFAATHPPHLAGLVMCAGFVTNPVGKLSRLIDPLVTPMMFKYLPLDSVLQYLLIGKGAPDVLKWAVRHALQSVNPEVLAQRVRAVLHCDAKEEIVRAPVPLMYIRAENDRLVRTACFKEIQQLRPAATMASIPAPHLVLQREPRKAAEAITQFIGGLDLSHDTEG